MSNQKTASNVLQLLLLATKMNQQKQPLEMFYKKDVLKACVRYFLSNFYFLIK